MPEKEKNKVQPFARYLHEGEEILWQSCPNVPVLQRLLPFIVFALIAIILIASCSVALFVSDPAWGVVPLVVLFPGLGLVQIVLLLTANPRSGSDPSQPAFYAVTSERLFFNQSDSIRIMRLEELATLKIIQPSTLNFGPLFPMWGNLEDAQKVRSIIEEAQQERRKAMRA